MKLKLLFFPAILIAIIYCAIALAYPAYTEMMQRREVLDAKQVQLNALKERAVLVQDIINALNAESALQSFLFQYIPMTRDEDAIISAIDDVAKRAAINLVVVNATDDSETSHRRINQQEVIGAPAMLIEPTEGMSAVESVPIRPPKTRTLDVTLTAMGEYDGVRKFFSFLHDISRSYSIDSATISRAEVENLGGSAEVTDKTLLVRVTAAFPYMESVSVPEGASGHIFVGGIDLEKIRPVYLRVTALPTLDTTLSPRNNPFVPADDPEQRVDVSPEPQEETSPSEDLQPSA